VPGAVLAGFAAAGALYIGIAPTAIVFAALWLMHRHIAGLEAAVERARETFGQVATHSHKQRAEMDKLEARLAGHAQELLLAQETTTFALTKMVEARDPSTGVHLERVRAYTKLLASTLAHTPRYRNVVDERFVAALHSASPLHDIGKVGIADLVLLKPASLTPEEWVVMRRHATMGGRLLRSIARRGGDNPYIETAYEAAMYHHERWDGSGYPFGLPGSHIPLAARLVALADVYDALTSRRCYKPAYTHAESRAYIVRESGRHFDPEVVEAFLARELDFVRIREALTGDMPLDSEDVPAAVHARALRGAA
jgi:putative two-component system response regulator